MRFIDLKGKVFNHWTVLYQIENNKHNLTCWMCRCSCGTISKVTGKNLKNGQSKGCYKFCSRKKTMLELFFSHVDKKSDCWIWKGYTGRWGYGSFRFKNQTFLAHRVSWILHKGEIPKGLFVCHTCDVPACVNPNHLWLGSHYENMHDMIKKGRYINGVKGKTWKVKRKNNV